MAGEGARGPCARVLETFVLLVGVRLFAAGDETGLRVAIFALLLIFALGLIAGVGDADGV